MKVLLPLILLVAGVTSCEREGIVEQDPFNFDPAYIPQISYWTGLYFPPSTLGMNLLINDAGPDMSMKCELSFSSADLNSFIEHNLPLQRSPKASPVSNPGIRWWKPHLLREPVSSTIEKSSRNIDVTRGFENDRVVIYISF